MKILENPQRNAETKLPWFVAAFCYPASMAGLVHLGSFLVAQFFIGFLYRYVLSSPLGAIIIVMLYIIVYGYVLYWLSYCLVDSSRGGRKAPDINVSGCVPDREQLLGQIFLILGCFAICFWPVSVYFVLTMNTDWLFVLLLMSGVFFLPMGLLRGALFDCLDALNPVLIIRSISKTFLFYCGLVLFFSVITALMVFVLGDLSALLQVHSLKGWLVYVFYLLARFSQPDFILRSVVVFYLAMIVFYLLGRFYWRHKQQLGWGI